MTVHDSTLWRCTVPRYGGTAPMTWPHAFPGGRRGRPIVPRKGKAWSSTGRSSGSRPWGQPAQRGLLRRMRDVHGAGRAARGEGGRTRVAASGGDGRRGHPLQDLSGPRQVEPGECGDRPRVGGPRDAAARGDDDAPLERVRRRRRLAGQAALHVLRLLPPPPQVGGGEPRGHDAHRVEGRRVGAGGLVR